MALQSDELIHLLTPELEFFCEFSPSTGGESGSEKAQMLEKVKIIIGSMLSLLENLPKAYRLYLHILLKLLGLAQ